MLKSCSRDCTFVVPDAIPGEEVRKARSWPSSTLKNGRPMNGLPAASEANVALECCGPK